MNGQTRSLVSYVPKGISTFGKLTVLIVAVLVGWQVLACAALTNEGTLCRRPPSPGSKFCWQHGGTTAAQRAMGLTDADVARMQCKATTASGGRCKRAAQAGSSFCWRHAMQQEWKTASPVSGDSKVAETVLSGSVTQTVEAVTADHVQCEAVTRSGKRCSRKALQGGTRCWQHEK